MTSTETTETTSTETTETTPTGFVRKQGEAGSVRETNDPRDFMPALRADGTKLNARGDVRGEPESEKRRAFEALKQSMKEQMGNIQPIGITVVPTFQRLRDKTLPRGYVVWGERRWAAAMDLFNEGVTVSLKYITVAEGTDATTAMALENLARLDLTQIEKSAFVRRLVNEGKTDAEIAKICGRSGPWVEQMKLLSGDRVSPELYEATKEGKIPTMVTLEMAREVEPGQQASALREMMEITNGNKTDARRAIADITGKSTVRPGKKQVECLSDLIAAAVKEGISGQVEASDLLNTMKMLLDWTQGKKSDKVFRRHLKEVFGELVDFGPAFGLTSAFNKRAQKAASGRKAS
jgi:ParB-like chromosome segregation protein Spo0J